MIRELFRVPVREAIVPAVAVIVLFVGLFCSGCKHLGASQPIDAATAGPVILDALEWGEESIERDTELNDFERKTALRSVHLARNIITTAQGK